VRDGETGLLVEPNDASALADALQWAVDNPDRLQQMGRNARHVYDTRYRGPAHLETLLETYRFAAANRSR
jgi:glycosyltransferase involved in cell wall biosynthesis